MADAVHHIGTLFHHLLSDTIPYPVFRMLARFSNLIYHLLGSANNPASWSSTLLPPLVTFLLVYFALVTAYRTLRSMLSLAWFGIKWGAVVAGLIAVWAWWTDNTDAIGSTGTVPGTGGLLAQLNSLGPLMNTLYTQLPDLSSSDGASWSTSRRQPTTRRRTRSSTRANQHAFQLDPTADLPDDLGSGFSAFADMFSASTPAEERLAQVDFTWLLRTLVVEGQSKGIDAMAALRAAGRVHDELRRFQTDPSGWFDAVGQRFRTAPDEGVGAGAGAGRSRTRQRASAARGGTAGEVRAHDSWWTNIASGVNDFLRREPHQQTGHRSRNRRT